MSGCKTGSPGKEEGELALFLAARGAWKELLLPHKESWEEKDKTEEVLKSSYAVNLHSKTNSGE